MNSPKLLEAIAELEGQRKIIDDAIVHLRRALAALSVSATTEVPKREVSTSGAPASYVDEAVLAIQHEGHALHVSKIVDYIGSVRGQRPARASVESSLIRHIAKTKDPKLTKTAPSTYDLTSNTQRTLPIAS